MLVHRGQRRQTEASTDLLETGRIAVLFDELVQVVQDLPLPLCERLHAASSLGTESVTPL